MGLGQADLPAAARVDLGAPRISSPVTSHSVPTKLASVVSVVLPVVWPPVLPPVLPTVVLTLGHQDAHHGQEERLVCSRIKVVFGTDPMFSKKPNSAKKKSSSAKSPISNAFSESHVNSICSN